MNWIVVQDQVSRYQPRFVLLVLISVRPDATVGALNNSVFIGHFHFCCFIFDRIGVPQFKTRLISSPLVFVLHLKVRDMALVVWFIF
jgi:hypothetical protein